MTSEESVNNTENAEECEIQRKSSSVDSSRSERASGNRMREDLQTVESSLESIQITKICELASFWKPCGNWQLSPDMDDGFGYSLPRWDRGSTILGAILGGTVIGPVVRFLTAQIVGTRD